MQSALAGGLDGIRSLRGGIDTRSARPSATRHILFWGATTMTKERMEELRWLWENAYEDEDWWEDLTEEEAKLVESWDDSFEQATAKMAKGIQNIRNKKICKLWDMWVNRDPYDTDWQRELTWTEYDLISRWEDHDPEAMDIIRKAQKATNAGIGEAISL